MIELDRYRRLLRANPDLKDCYSEWEERVSSAGGCKAGAVVGFLSDRKPNCSLALCFGQVLCEPDEELDDDPDFHSVAWVLLETGHDIRLVPLGLIRFAAYPTFDGKWIITTGQAEFGTLFTETPCFGDLPLLKEDSFELTDDFQDSALSALQQLVTKHGISSLLEPGRVKSIMRDLAPEPSWGPNVISLAVELGIVQRLLDETQAYDLLRPTLVRRLYDSGPEEERARWAVDRLAIVIGRFGARALLWCELNKFWLSPKDRIVTYQIMTGQRQTYSAAESITDYATAFVVDLEDCLNLSDTWPFHFPVPPGMDEAQVGEEVLRGVTVVRVRDEGNRLLFSYIFEDNRAAQIAVRSLRAFHSNRRKLLDWARAGCLAGCIVTELSPASPDDSLICCIASACSDDVPVVIGFYGSANENWPRESLVSALQEIAPEFAGRCRFHTISVSSVSDEEIGELFPDYLSTDFPSLPLIAGFYRGELVESNDGDFRSDSLRGIVQSVLRYKEKLDEQAADDWAWRYIYSDDYYEVLRHIVTTALVKTHDDSGGGITTSTATSFLEDLKRDAWGGINDTIFGLLTSSQAVAQETIAALFSALPYVRAKVAVIHAAANSSVWHLLVPMTMFEQESVLFKLHSPADESGDVGAYFSRNSADPSGEFMSLAKGGTERAWEFVSPCMSSAELRRYADAEFADESLVALVREELRPRDEQLREELRQREEQRRQKPSVADLWKTFPDFGPLMFSKEGTTFGELLKHIEALGEPKLIFIHRRGGWRELALAKALDFVIFTDYYRDWEFDRWLSNAFEQFKFFPKELPILLAIDKGHVDCAANSYINRHRAEDGAGRVENIDDLSFFRKWRAGTLRDLDRLVKSFEDEPAPVWEHYLQAGGTWNEYLRIVEDWLSAKVVERGLDQRSWPESTIDEYFLRCLPKLRVQTGR